MEETLRALVAFGLTLLLVLLRLEAQRFGTAEYDEPVAGRPPALLRQLAWYGIGVGGFVALLWVHPRPDRELFLGVGDRLGALFFGVVLGVLGAAQAIGLAWARYRHLRLPHLAAYPGALANEVLTAFIDEAVFRGALLGFLVIAGVEPWLAVLLQTMTYLLATRLGAPGRSRPLFLLAAAIGLATGWVTVVTGGFAAAFIGHAATRVAVFLTTGHAGQPAPVGFETEDELKRRRIPEGWRAVRSREGGRGRA